MSTPVPPALRETANDRLKRRFAGVWWNSVTAAVVLHFLLFAFFPRMTAADMGRGSDPTDVIVLPPPIPIPPPPAKLARPMAPVPTPGAPENLTLPLLPREERTLPPLPPPNIIDERRTAERWIPHTVKPRLQNTEEIRRALSRLYPSTLRAAGVDGQTVVWFYIDENGRVVRTEVKEPSEYAAFDDAALKVADLMRFAPAQNRDRPVAVWVALSIRFTARTP